MDISRHKGSAYDITAPDKEQVDDLSQRRQTIMIETASRHGKKMSPDELVDDDEQPAPAAEPRVANEEPVEEEA